MYYNYILHDLFKVIYDTTDVTSHMHFIEDIVRCVYVIQCKIQLYIYNL